MTKAKSDQMGKLSVQFRNNVTIETDYSEEGEPRLLIINTATGEIDEVPESPFGESSFTFQELTDHFRTGIYDEQTIEEICTHIQARHQGMQPHERHVDVATMDIKEFNRKVQ